MPSFARIGDDYKFSYKDSVLFYGDGSCMTGIAKKENLVSFDGRHFKFLSGLEVDVMTNVKTIGPKPTICADRSHVSGLIQLRIRTDLKMAAMLVAMRKKWPQGVGSHIASYLPSMETKTQVLFTYPKDFYSIAVVLYCPRNQVAADRRKKRKVLKSDYDLSRSAVVDSKCGYLGTVKDIIERGIQQNRHSAYSYRLESDGQQIDISLRTYSTNGVLVSWGYLIVTTATAIGVIAKTAAMWKQMIFILV